MDTNHQLGLQYPEKLEETAPETALQRPKPLETGAQIYQEEEADWWQKINVLQPRWYELKRGKAIRPAKLFNKAASKGRE